MSSFGNNQIRDLWRQSKPIVWRGHYWMLSFAPQDRAQALKLIELTEPVKDYVSLICDQHEVAVILPDHVMNAAKEQGGHNDIFGPLACITLDVPLDIEVSGYLQPAVHALANAEISIVPQCALIYDHILVHDKDRASAIKVLSDLQKRAEAEASEA